MTHGISAELPADAPVLNPEISADVPTTLDVLPDGRETVVIGDVNDAKDFNHLQGDNPYGYQGTCGLVSCQDVIDQFGGHVTEADVVDHAVFHGLCEVTGDPAMSGGTTPDMQAQILNDYGVPAHVDSGQSLEDLAGDVERGSGVIVEVNAGRLWNDPNALENGQSNHAVTVTGVARDPQTGEIQGFYINDSGTGESGKFVDADTMTKAWSDTGGMAVLTDVVHTGGAGQ